MLSTGIKLPTGFDPTTGFLSGGAVVPTDDWRLQILAANTADSTWNTALQAQHTAKTIPQKTAAVAASTTYTMYLQLAAIADPGGMLFLDWTASGATVPTFTVSESFGASADGSDLVDYAAVPFDPWKPSGHTLATQYSTVGQIIMLDAGASRWVKLVIQTGSGVTCRPYLAAFQFKEDESEPLFAGIGMSITYSNMTSLITRAAIQAAVPGSDPIWINMARGGANSAAIKTEEIDVLAAGGPNNQFSRIRAVLYDFGPNDRLAALNGGTTYAEDADPAVIGTLFTTNFNALAAVVGAGNVYCSNIGFGNVTGLAGNFASDDGFLPYNLLQVHPAMESLSTKSWSQTYDSPILDDFLGQASDYEGYLIDEVHNGTFGAAAYAERRYPVFRQMYRDPVGDTTIDMLMEQVGTGAKAAMKTRLQGLFDTLGDTTSATAARDALQARITAIVTTYAEPTVTAPAILPSDPGISTGTLIADWDAADFEAITRLWNGYTSEWLDSKNARAATQGTATTVLRPVLRPTQEDAPARMVFAGPSATQSLAISHASIIGMLDAANQAYTVFGVLDTEAAGASGLDVFGIGHATLNFLILAISPNGAVPRFYIGDGGGGAFFSSGDTSLVAGQRIAFALRNNGLGTTNGLKYYRGAVSTLGTSARVNAKTGTAAAIGRRAQGSTQYFNGGLNQLSLFTGSMSDAEVGNVLAGLREKWDAI